MARRSARAALRLVQARFEDTRSTHARRASKTPWWSMLRLAVPRTCCCMFPPLRTAAGLKRPTVADWSRINRSGPRLVDALPNGPRNHPTVQVFLAGGVPEVMLHLRRAGLLNTKALTVSGETLDQSLDWWEQSERRMQLRKLTSPGWIDADDVILAPDKRAPARTDFHRLLSQWQSCARGFRGQSHRD